MSNKRGQILVTRVLGNEILNIGKKILPARPKTALGRKSRNEKKKGYCKPFALHKNAVMLLNIICFSLVIFYTSS